MKLYRVQIRTYDNFYVVAEDETSAYKKLLNMFEKNDLYFTNDRKLKMIEIIGECHYDSKDIFKEED